MASKPLPKPLSERALQRKYAQLAEITHGRIDISTDRGNQLSSLLHQYIAAFSNLYGVIAFKAAWNLFCEVEPEMIRQKKVLKKDFFALGDILRAESLPYYILNLDELFPDEPSDKPLERIIVNKKLVGYGYYRFCDLYTLLESQENKSGILLDKKEYLAWADPDYARKAPCAKNLLRFLESLRVSDDSKNCDVDGQPIRGKTLDHFIFWNKDETFLYNYVSRKWEKDIIAAENNLIESEKLMQKIERNIHLGDNRISPSRFIALLVDNLEEMGVQLSEKELNTLLALYTDMNNQSRLWCNCGWTPEEMFGMSKPGNSFSPGAQAAFANSDTDREEFGGTPQAKRPPIFS